MINEIPVSFPELYFVSAAESFQPDTQKDDQGHYVETGKPATSYDETAYLLDIQVGTYVRERGLEAWAGQGITVEVPIEGAEAALKRIREMPRQTPIRFSSVTARPGVSANKKLYVMWTGKGLETLARQSVPAQAPRPAQA